MPSLSRKELILLIRSNEGLSDLDLTESDLSNANLYRGNLDGLNLSCSSLADCNLRE